MRSEHLSEIYHTEQGSCQRYVATDTASELHVLMWTHGISDATRRVIVQEVLAIIARGQEPRMHQRRLNELSQRLAQVAVSIIAPCLTRQEDLKDAFMEFAAAFRDELIRHEVERERMQRRLGKPEPE